MSAFGGIADIAYASLYGQIHAGTFRHGERESSRFIAFLSQHFSQAEP